MSQLDALPGNSRVKFFLKKLLKKTPHAILFEGPKGVGKGRFAKRTLQGPIARVRVLRWNPFLDLLFYNHFN